MEGILKRRGAENAEEVFQKELGSATTLRVYLQTPVGTNQSRNPGRVILGRAHEKSFGTSRR